MSTIRNIRNFFAKIDTENFDGTVPTFNRSNQSKAIRGNLVDATFEGVNAIVGGTPVSWITGPATIILGLAKIFGGIVAGLGGGWIGPGEQASNRMMASGLKSVVAGAAAPFPVIGNAVNAALAGIDTIQLVNTVVPTKEK